MGISQYTALAAAEDPSTGVVVATGLVIVFSVLVLLYLIISLEGVIFSSLDKNKKNKTGKGGKKEAAAQEASSSGTRQNIAPVAVEKGIPAEIIAAISAAVAAMEGGSRYVIRSLTRAKRDRSAWSNAAAISYTEPF